MVPAVTAPDMTIEKCLKVLLSQKPNLYFDYLYGRVMKVNITHDEFDPWLYDRDNGNGAAQRAIDNLRNETYS